MITRDEFVGEARTWLDTPWQHQGRYKGLACDCVGLVLETARALGLIDFDFTNYERRPDGVSLREHCNRLMQQIPVAQAGPADVLLFAWNNSPIHLAIVTGPDTVIHAFAINRRVIEHRIDERWRAQIAAAYHIAGVE
ncbi:C40 family peptidase [Cupriavidus necator]